MHIGIVGTRTDSAVLVRSLNEIGYRGPVTIYSDRSQRPLSAKSFKLQQQSVLTGVNQLKDNGCTHCIVPPESEKEMTVLPVLSLFSTYCNEFVIKHSLVGKLGWLMGTPARSWISGESVLKSIQPNLSFRSTSCAQRELLGLGHSNRHHVLRHAVRTSLRPLRDAAVDTLVPTQRGQLYFQRIVTQQTSRKNIRFHGTDALKSVLEGLLPSQALSQKGSQEGSYAPLRVLSSDGETDPLLTQLRFRTIMSVGGQREIV